MIYTLGNPRKGVHVMHYGDSIDPMTIPCGGWKGGGTAQWTDEKPLVTCWWCRVKRCWDVVDIYFGSAAQHSGDEGSADGR